MVGKTPKRLEGAVSTFFPTIYYAQGVQCKNNLFSFKGRHHRKSIMLHGHQSHQDQQGQISMDIIDIIDVYTSRLGILYQRERGM